MARIHSVNRKTVGPKSASAANGKKGGRPKQSLSPATKMFRRQLTVLTELGQTPKQVMLENMLYWHKRTEAAEKAIMEMLKAQDLSYEDRMRLLKLLETHVNARDKSQKCAVDAAPYCHAKLASLTLTPEKPKDERPAVSMTDEELVEIVAQGMSTLVQRKQDAAGMTTIEQPPQIEAAE